ncbi:MAG: ThiF family adenylyltransferase, partial [Verrucomicrobia bacterium]|nr:ThiF family adenylyltransferase [Verrucomicrobiota bacterium]
TTRKGSEDGRIVVVDGQDIKKAVLEGVVEVDFSVRDDSVFSALPVGSASGHLVSGVIRIRNDDRACPHVSFADSQIIVELAPIKTGSETSRHGQQSIVSVNGNEYIARAWIGGQAPENEADMRVVPVRSELFSRARGLLETGVLAGKIVLLKGLGSVGSTVARLLAQSGVCQFILMDDDRLDVANVIRHEAGLSHIGRFKTRFMAALIHEKNPYAEVETVEEKASERNIEYVRALVARASLCVDTADERKGKSLFNRACLEEGKPLIISGAFQRAHGGQVLRVRPGKSACYGCFTKMLKGGDTAFPDGAAEAIAYSDRPVPIEPGLSIDIDPISHMTAKLVLQELLRDVPTTLRSLDEDLEANWYLYLNRREEGTQYENLDPLGFGIDGMRILRWYGVDFKRDPECPICGDFADALARQTGVTVTEEEKAAFMEAYAPKGVKHG